MESVAGFAWNRWPDSPGIGGRIHLESVAGFIWNRWPDSPGIGGRIRLDYALQRLAGRRDDAVDLLVLSRPLAMLAKDPKVDADWYQKAAYLLVDLSRLSRAEEFLLRAHTLYDVAGERAERLRTLVDRAYVLTHAGKHIESLAILEAVLPQLPTIDRENHIAVHQLMAGNLQALGDLAGARKRFSAAIELVGDDCLALATCLWRQAKLLLALGDVSRAIDMFGQAMPFHAKVTGAGELAELGMEFAAVLWKQGRRPELRAFAADLSGWIEQLKGNLKLRTIVEDFQALIEFDELDMQKFANIQERVRKAKISVR